MIEILFTESAAGSMKVAKSRKYGVGFSTAVFIMNDVGSEQSPEKLAPEQSRMEEESRNKHENIVAMEGTAQDVAWFPLNLSMGDISDPFSDRRAEYLQSTVLIGGPEFANIGRELMETARKSRERILSPSKPVRIWTSRNPDELCGFCHILTCLPETADIRVVELPAGEVIGDELRTYSGWGDIEPTDLGRFQALERPLTATERRDLTALWRKLQEENGPLRAVIGGKLRTVKADHYDELFLRELYRQPEEFHEARFIGEILGKYPLGIRDSLIALRVEEWITQGIVSPVTASEDGLPIYHRYLRREKVRRDDDDWRLLSVDDDLYYQDIDPTDGEEIGLHAPRLTHCAFCWTEVVHSRHQWWYVPTDQSCCICETCFHDFKELFHWRELDGWDLEWKKKG